MHFNAENQMLFHFSSLPSIPEGQSKGLSRELHLKWLLFFYFFWLVEYVFSLKAPIQEEGSLKNNYQMRLLVVTGIRIISREKHMFSS